MISTDPDRWIGFDNDPAQVNGWSAWMRVSKRHWWYLGHMPRSEGQWLWLTVDFHCEGHGRASWHDRCVLCGHRLAGGRTRDMPVRMWPHEITARRRARRTGRALLARASGSANETERAIP
jgi:hypothetical protein